VNEYSGYNIKQLWQMVDAARQGLQPSRDQVAALDKAQQMLSGHAQSLEEARDQLAMKWPPETNSASAAYINELDRLIAAVRETALTCAVNVFHINTVSEAIVQAHDTLAPLHVEFVKNEDSLARYDASIEAFGEGASLIPGGSTVAKGAAKLFTSPPVDDGRQDELTLEAQQAMVPLAEAAHDGATYIKAPAPYVPPTVDDSPITENPIEFGGSAGASNTSGAALPPIIDPPANTRAHGIGTTAGQSSDMTAEGPITGFGPTLSSLTPTPVQALIPALPTGHGPESPLGASPGLISGLHTTPTGGYSGRLPVAFGPTNGNLGRGPFGNVGGQRGGVIGNVPAATGPGRSAPSRVNPLGGVIGQQPGVGSKGAARLARSQTVGGDGTGIMSSRAGQLGRSRARAEIWDPDNPWEVDEGVDPVIMPDSAPRCIDPGPGIIGIDR